MNRNRKVLLPLTISKSKKSELRFIHKINDAFNFFIIFIYLQKQRFCFVGQRQLLILMLSTSQFDNHSPQDPL